MKNQVYEYVNARIMDQMKTGVIPWQKPWRTERPRNPVTGISYKGINVWLTGYHRASHNFKSVFYLTYNQISKLGGKINVGEKSRWCMITFFKIVEEKNPEDKENPKSWAIFKYYRAYNIEQTTLDPEQFETEEPVPVESDFMQGYEEGPRVEYVRQEKACYNSRTDIVTIPDPRQFKREDELRMAVYHELAHSTGHADRLNRKLGSGYGALDYAREELVAEITATYLMQEIGHEWNVENPTAYIQSWLGRLTDDPKLFVWAAARAEKATEYILDRPKK